MFVIELNSGSSNIYKVSYLCWIICPYYYRLYLVQIYSKLAYTHLWLTVCFFELNDMKQLSLFTIIRWFYSLLIFVYVNVLELNVGPIMYKNVIAS